MQERDEPARPMSAEDAMRTMATVTAHTRGLRVRTEGLTLVIFALCIMASYVNLAAPILGAGPGPDGPLHDGPDPTSNDTGPRPMHRPPPTMFFLSRFAPLAWYAIAVVVTLAIWRSASLSFHTGLSTPRLLGVFVGWLGLFAGTLYVLAFLQGGDPRGWHLVAWGVVLGLFALLDPLRFQRPSRVVVGVMAVTAIAVALYAFAVDLRGHDVGFLSGLALGVPGLAGGLWLMYRG